MAVSAGGLLSRSARQLPGAVLAWGRLSWAQGASRMGLVSATPRLQELAWLWPPSRWWQERWACAPTTYIHPSEELNPRGLLVSPHLPQGRSRCQG